ncbi:MAG: TonB-dependent receptor, partial [Pedobacter sp.]
LSAILFIDVQAQDSRGKISGLLMSEKKKSISAVITIKSLKDSTFIKTTVSDATGIFYFENLPVATYLVSVKAIGFQTVDVKIEISATQLSVDKTLLLTEENINLGSVNISGKKPLIERFSDKTVMNLENSIVASGNTALEVLAKMPGVSVNQDGIINVKGKSGVNVLIDGKTTYLSAEQLVTRLRSLSSSELKSIELITNPSAKYDAEGNAGVINLKLKKNTGFGTNGNLDLGFGYGKNPKSNAGISLNHRNKNFNIFGNLAHNNNKYQEDLDINRITNNGISNTFFHQYNTQIRSSHNNNYKAGIDYFINEKNTIGFLTSGYFNNGHEKSNGITDIGTSFI